MSRGNREWNVSTGDRDKSCSTSYTVGVKNTVLVSVRVFSFKRCKTGAFMAPALRG